MKTRICRLLLCLVLNSCLCLIPCICLWFPAVGAVATDGEDAETTLCTLMAGHATQIDAPPGGEEREKSVEVPVYLEGTLTGTPAGVMFTAGLSGPWHLAGIRPGTGAEGLTLTVRETAGKPDAGTEGATERYIILLDGPGVRTPGGALVILTLTYLSATDKSPGETEHEPAEQGVLTLTPVEGDACVYLWTADGGLTAQPLVGSETLLTLFGPYGSDTESDPESDSACTPESDTGDDSGSDTGQNTEEASGPGGEESSGTAESRPADVDCSFRYVGCQEARYGDGLLSVRFLFLVPEDTTDTAFPPVWLTGGGTAVLSVSCDTSVAVWSGVSGRPSSGRPASCQQVAAPPGTRYLILTYTGLDVGRTYLFTLDTGTDFAHVVYEHGTYKEGEGLSG